MNLTSSITSLVAFYKITSLLVLLICAFTERRVRAEQNVTFKAPPVIAPPSEDFCAVNKLGDQIYPISVFQACTFKFYANTDTDESQDSSPFSCENKDLDDSTYISTEYHQVLLWPDVCVANGPRCYSIKDNPSLVNLTIYSDAMFASLQNVTDDETMKKDIQELQDMSQYSLTFPNNATVVSVDCSEDFEKAQEFAHDFPQIADEISHGLTVFSIILLLCVLMCVCTACACLVTCCSRGASSKPKAHYSAVPGTDQYVGPPVQVKKFEGTPSYQIKV